MKLYACGNCGSPVYFENDVCTDCSHWLGYLAGADQMVALSPNASPWQPFSNSPHSYRYCANHQHRVCNWLIPLESESELCTACNLNRTIPNVDDPERLAEWRELEFAKHRLVYALLRLGLPVEAQTDSLSNKGIAFDFLSEEDADDPVMTGHADGLVTINSEEADPVVRERTRVEMQERYRTLIGHFRHEIGHYYWDRLIAEDPIELPRFRQLFGDERADYGKALKRYYRNGPRRDWASAFISPYATAHPWEDWAETWAHYHHLLGLLDTAYSFGLSTAPRVDRAGTLTMRADFDPFTEIDPDRIIDAGIPLALAVNSLNRSLGKADPYPFVIPDPVKEKLVYVHRLIHQQQ
jgi:hypothetical protein